MAFIFAIIGLITTTALIVLILFLNFMVLVAVPPIMPQLSIRFKYAFILEFLQSPENELKTMAIPPLKNILYVPILSLTNNIYFKVIDSLSISRNQENLFFTRTCRR